jgi:hypothetical protein
MRIFDPFCGTATTALSAAYHGHEGNTTDINPFLVWLGTAKTAQYSTLVLASTRHACTRALDLAKRKKVEPVPPPPIHKIERWWSESTLQFLCALRAAIDAVTDARSQERALLLVAFCRTLISCSNASFSHQSMSFKHEGQNASLFEHDSGAMFAEDVRFVLNGAEDNPDGRAHVLLGDSRHLATAIKGKVDRVITSPPYANRMSYIRELRPYMYWLGFLENGRDAGELDWAAIGGTWGVATSRLMEWERSMEKLDLPQLEVALASIRHNDNKNGELLANYVAKYFDDMWTHFRGLPPILASGAELHYIVGNSTFYGVLLSVEELYASMLKELGFTNVKCTPIRKRNSKKELIEFDVSATWK